MAHKRVFGRDRGHRHEYDSVLDEWERSSKSEYRFMARNLRADHRVSVDREKSFDSMVGRPVNSESLYKAIDAYNREKIRSQKTPEFSGRINKNNFVDARSRDVSLRSDSYLGTVVCLNKMRAHFEWDAGRTVGRTGPKRRSVFEELTSAGTVDKFLDDKLGGRLHKNCEVDPDVHEFIKSFLRVLRAYRRQHPRQPSWAAVWDDLVPFLPEDSPHRWAQAVGVCGERERVGEWWIVLKYKIRNVPRLVRPTQLDVGWYPWHFPSPAGLIASRGGFTMDLCAEEERMLLVREYIHEQIDHTLQHWREGGCLLGRAESPIRPDDNHDEFIRQKRGQGHRRHSCGRKASGARSER